MMGATGFDRATSNQVDSTIGEGRNPSKTLDANDNVYALAA